jgi:hypothetical protein
MRAVIIVGADRLQQWLLRAGLVISAMLLIRFAIDFSEEMRWWLAVPFSALVLVTLGVGAANVLGPVKTASVQQPPRDLKQVFLMMAIPVGFLASSLDCTGLSLHGCSPFCSLVKLAWIPLIACVCAVYIVTGAKTWLSAIASMSFVPLVPHCVCYNVGNSWWIDRIGLSPLCYGWGFVVSVVAISAVRRGSNFLPSLSLCFAIVAGACAFFFAHHYFQFPW